MTRRTRVLAGTAVLAAAAVAAGVVALSGATQATPAAPPPPATTAAVTRGRLSDTVALDGTLTRRARPDGSPYAAINRARGIYTALPAVGDEVGCGDVLYRVDDDPVLLLCGTVPAYRDLDRGDAGRDVRQLNRNLHALGHDADPGDRDFTWRTQAALEALQHAAGADRTGAVELGDAVFLPRRVRIAKVAGALGGSARPGAQVVQATSDTLEVQVDLAASQQGEVQRGDRARITLPGNRSAQGTVDRLGRIARTAGEEADAGSATLPASIRLDTPARARGLDQAPVQVEIATRGVRNALGVPVIALVGRSGGGFAVEVVREGGRRELVAVRPGLFDSTAGRVEVEGELAAGDRVVVPSS